MDQMILATPDMALDLAKILFSETQGKMKFEWFSPFKVEDDDDIWFISGRIDPTFTLPPDAMDEQFENPIFHMHVAKADSEVKDVGLSYGMKLPPDVKGQIRATLEAEGNTPAELQAKRSRNYAPDIWLNTALHGGIINSNDAAIRFGGLIFENHFIPTHSQLKKMRAELLDGIWHVTGPANRQSAEIFFRRSNAQVISLDLRPI